MAVVLRLCCVSLSLMTVWSVQFLNFVQADDSPELQLQQLPDVLPLIIGRENNPAIRLSVTVPKAAAPVHLQSVQLSTAGTTRLSDLVDLRVHHSQDKQGRFRTSQQVSQAVPAADRVVLPCEPPLALPPGEHHLWISVSLTDTVRLDHDIQLQNVQLQLSSGRTISVDASPVKLRPAVAVRDHNDDEVHTYRIPGLTTTAQGTLIAVYDIRYDNFKDLPGNIDVGMSRSTDHGQTWEPMQTIMDMGSDPDWHYDGIGDPAVLVDRNTGTIWVAALWSHGNQGWRGSGQGIAPAETGQVMLVRSDDDGKTWSQPINITPQIKHPDWCLLLQGPGKGITMTDGTLVFAAQFQDSEKNQRIPRSTIMSSTDHGKTWQIGTGAFDATTEAQVVEVEPGVLMLNCRYDRDNKRVVVTTRDLGKTWTEHKTSRTALLEPKACMASLISPAGETTGKPGPWLLFSNPQHATVRRNMTIQASPDSGTTWHATNRGLLDSGRSAGYSCLTMIDESTVGILYEGSQSQLTFQRVPVSELVND